MSKMSIIILVAGFATLIVFLLSRALNSVSAPTSGNPIPQYLNPGAALLIMDVQEGQTGSGARSSSPYAKDSGRFISRINRLIGHACQNGIEIAYLKMEFEGWRGRIMSAAFHSGTGMKDTPGAALDQRLLMMSGQVFSRSHWDAFSNPDFEAFLASRQVSELYIAGIDALYTVYATAQGALQRGYKVTIINDAVMLGSPSKLASLLDRYRAEGVNLISSSSFLKWRI